MEPSNLPTTSDIVEAAGRTLKERGAGDAVGLQTLFAQLERCLSEDLARLEQGSQESLRLRWLGRKQGIIRSVTDNWLRPAPAVLKRQVGKRLNALCNETERRGGLPPSSPSAPEVKKPRAEPAAAKTSPVPAVCVSRYFDCT